MRAGAITPMMVRFARSLPARDSAGNSDSALAESRWGGGQSECCALDVSKLGPKIAQTWAQTCLEAAK